MPKTDARATVRGRWSPSIRCISSLDTKACTTPDSPNPSTRAHKVSQNMKKPSRRLSPTSPGLIQARRCVVTSLPPGPRRPVRSRSDQAGDRRRRLGHLLLRTGAAFGHRLRHAVAQVVVEQLERHRLESPVDRRDLAQDVDAVPLLLDHPLKTPDLTFDAAEPVLDGHLVVAVPGHAPSSPCPSLYPDGV